MEGTHTSDDTHQQNDDGTKDVLQAESSLVPPNKKKFNVRALLVGLAAVVLVALVAGAVFLLADKDEQEAQVATPVAKKLRIGLSMATLTELRWQLDRKYIVERAESSGASVTVMVADKDNQKQLSQIDNLISQKVDVLIVVASDATALKPAIDAAHAAGIKVIAYDRMILNSDVDMYVSFDSVKVGALEAQYVMDAIPKTIAKPRVALLGGSPTDNNAFLVKQGVDSIMNPLVKAGKASIVLDQFIDGWKPDLGYNTLKKYLDGGGQVDAVVAANDGLALGAIQALQERGLAGKVPVSGQDAELPAVQRLVQGTQTVTVYKPLRKLAYKAVDNALALAQSKAPEQNGVLNNKLKDVSAYLLDPIAVTKQNIDSTVIQDRHLTSKEIYNN